MAVVWSVHSTARQQSEILKAALESRDMASSSRPRRLREACELRARRVNISGNRMIPLIILVIIVVVLLTGIRIAKEYERGVVFRLGRHTGQRGPGLYWLIPLGIERAVTIDIRTRTVSAEQQQTITRDSVTVKVNAVLWYHVTDAGKSVIAVADAAAAVYQLALSSLRNIIG